LRTSSLPERPTGGPCVSEERGAVVDLGSGDREPPVQRVDIKRRDAGTGGTGAEHDAGLRGACVRPTLMPFIAFCRLFKVF
jgi:hypothetical protein